MPFTGSPAQAAYPPHGQPPPYVPPTDPSYSPGGFGSTPYSDRVPPASDSANPWGAPADSFRQPVPGAAPVAPSSSFPLGAVVLIGLGVLFLLGSTHVFVALPLRFLLPFLLIGVGIYLFVRRMTGGGAGLADDGTTAYRLRLVRALQSSVWVILVGVLFLLDNLNILSWGRSWPLFIIVGGVMAFVQRSVYAAAAQQPIAYPDYSSTGSQPPPPPSTEPGTAIVPNDREGS